MRKQMDLPPDKQQRKFKGAYIPKELWFFKELSWIEKLFLIEVDLLSKEGEPCWASNGYFADFFNLSRQRCSQIIRGLVQKEWLETREEKKGNYTVRRLLWVSNKFDTLMSNKFDSIYQENLISEPTEVSRKFDRGCQKKLTPKSGEVSNLFSEVSRKLDKGCQINAQQRLVTTPTPTAKEINNTTTNTQGISKEPPVVPVQGEGVGGCISQSEKVLELDLKIAAARNTFLQEIAKLLKPNHREAVTFARIAMYFVDCVQKDPAKMRWFTDAVTWARQAMASNVSNKKGLWVAKVKERTGFEAQKPLLEKSGRLSADGVGAYFAAKRRRPEVESMVSVLAGGVKP